MSSSSISSISTTYSSDTDSDWDSEEGSNSNTSSYYDFALDDLLPVKLNLQLTKGEKSLIDEFYQKMEEVGTQNDQEYKDNVYNQNINCTENALKRIKCLVDEHLKRGIRLNASYNGHTVTNLIFEKIKDIADSTIHFRSTTYATPEPYRNADYNNNEIEYISKEECTRTDIDEKYADEWRNINGKDASEWKGIDEGYVSDEWEYLEKECADKKYTSAWGHWGNIEKCEEVEEYIEDETLKGNCLNIIESIISNLWMIGGRVERSSFYYNGLAHITYDIDNGLYEKCEEIESKLKDVAYESVINKQKGDFKVAIDNDYFYIKYEKNSVVELTKVTNNKIMEDLNSKYKLNLKVGILNVGESVIRVEKLGEKRNYIDVPKGKIKMTFTIKEEGKEEEISILLYSDQEDSSKIKVELDEENQKKFDKLKDKSSLGKNCFLGGKSVLQAIQDKEFTKYESCKSETSSILPTTILEQCSISNIFNSLKDQFTQFQKYLFSG